MILLKQHTFATQIADDGSYLTAIFCHKLPGVCCKAGRHFPVFIRIDTSKVLIHRRKVNLHMARLQDPTKGVPGIRGEATHPFDCDNSLSAVPKGDGNSFPRFG